ncbi:hypothetical protein HanRHA438_Chr03g0131841 [Helianthus annuus]|nr:hypothetical protein HanRHA438_Chr03g0131841 [Helianthus annuus]
MFVRVYMIVNIFLTIIKAIFLYMSINTNTTFYTSFNEYIKKTEEYVFSFFFQKQHENYIMHWIKKITRVVGGKNMSIVHIQNKIYICIYII